MNARAQHWAAPLVGLPYESAGNCWSFARDVLSRQHGVDLPAVALGDVDLPAIKAAFRENGMRRVQGRPQPGDLVVMRSPVLRTHVGVVIEAGGALSVLHATEQAGVLCEPFGEASAGRRIDLWRPHAGEVGDEPDWKDTPQDRDTFRSLLQVAATLAVNIVFPGGTLFGELLKAGAALGANAAVNALLPPTGLEPGRSPGQTATTFSASLSGNQARLDQPIWKTCGFDEINPPFAGQPYTRYLAREDDGSDPDYDVEKDREQYLYAVYAVGIGTHDVYPKLGKTPLSRYDDVIVAEYLAPGEQPTMAQANVVTNESVAGITLESGRYSPGFVACAARQTVATVGIIVSAPRGLGKGEDPLTVSWQVECREINDFGQVLTEWEVLGTETRTFYTATPQFWDEDYTIASPARLEVRVVRTDTQDKDATALHELAWAGLRCELDEPAPLNADCAHFELVMRTSAQLAGAAARDLRLIVQSKARTRSGGNWQAAAFTRNPCWWILDLATSNSGAWGLELTDSRINLDAFDTIGALADTRQDRFDYTFTDTTDAWEAMQLMARAIRSRVFRRNGVLSIARDQLADVPVTAFTPRNCIAGMKITETLRRSDSPDAVIVEYLDHRTREWTQVVCPVPGVAEVDVERPVYRKLVGITGATHAEREGMYEAANLLYRNRQAEWTTELMGLLPAYMSPVRWQPDIPGAGQAGDVVNWNETTLTATLSDHVDFTAAPIYIRLLDSDGTLTDAILISPGAEDDEVILASDPGIEVSVDAFDRERTKWLAGPLTSSEVVKVLSIGDGGQVEGAQMYALTGVIDDDRVHTADNALLPGPGDDQDPIGLPDDSEDTGGGGGEVLVLVNLTTKKIAKRSTTSTPTLRTVAFTLKNDGSAEADGEVLGSDVVDGVIAEQWLKFNPHETTTADDFEVRFTQIDIGTVTGTGANPVDTALTTGTLNTWLSLGTDRTIELENTLPMSQSIGSRIRVEIRKVSTGVVQTTKNVTLIVEFVDDGA